MSSILDALKKVEQTSSLPNKQGTLATSLPTTARQVKTHLPPQKNARANWPAWGLMFIVVSIGSIVIYDHLITSKSSLPPSTTVHAVVEEISQPAPAIPENLLEERNIPEKTPVDTIQEVALKAVKISRESPIETQGSVVREESSKKAMSPSIEQPEEKEVSFVDRENDQQIVTMAQSIQTIHEKQTETVGPVSEFNREPHFVEQEELPILEPGVLKLQAITWSPVENKRFIVVNNTISRARDIVDGYIISRINMDSVVVQQRNSDRKWLVEFRTR